MEIERRIHTGTGIEVRRANADSGVTTLRGYAAKFDTLSEPLFGFREKIAPDAFADVLENDVRALFNHDPNHVLGRSAAGTLRVQQDEVGLLYEVDLPDTQAARDLVTSIKRGDVSQSSFAFTVEKDDWQEDDEGRVIRTIEKFKRLYDVSPVTYPAYPDASVGLRSLEAWQKNRTEAREAEVAATAAAERTKREAAHARRARFLRLLPA